MPVPVCDLCGLRHRRDRSCNSRGVFVYRGAGHIAMSAAGASVCVRPEVAHSCGPMDNVCQHCRAHFWEHEDFSCCGKGDIHFPTEFPVCPELQNFLTSTHFKECIRQYNTAMAMASVGHDASIMPGGPSSVTLSGRTFHRVSGGMLAGNGWNPSFAQIYLLDTDDASNLRMNLQHQALNPAILRVLHTAGIAILECNLTVRIRQQMLAQDGMIVYSRWQHHPNIDAPELVLIYARLNSAAKSSSHRLEDGMAKAWSSSLAYAGKMHQVSATCWKMCTACTHCS